MLHISHFTFKVFIFDDVRNRYIIFMKLHNYLKVPLELEPH